MGSTDNSTVTNGIHDRETQAKFVQESASQNENIAHNVGKSLKEFVKNQPSGVALLTGKSFGEPVKVNENSQQVNELKRSPVPDPDTVYIQTQNGFIPATRQQLFNTEPEFAEQTNGSMPQPNIQNMAVQLAIAIQEGSGIIALIIQGLLSGLLVAQVIFLTLTNLDTFYEVYEKIAVPLQAIFQLFFVFALANSLDLLDCSHRRYFQSSSFLVVANLFGLISSLTLVSYEGTLAHKFGSGELKAQLFGQHYFYKALNFIRGACAFIAWILLAVESPRNATIEYLRNSMQNN